MAQAILLQDVESLGERGTVIDISPGYLRNYLIPRKLAQTATDASIEEARRRIEAEEKARREQEERSGENAALLNKTVLTITRKAGEGGHLFGSVSATDIAAAIKEARGLKLDKNRVLLPEPIKSVGTYMVEIEVTSGITSTIKTMIVAEK